MNRGNSITFGQDNNVEEAVLEGQRIYRYAAQQLMFINISYIVTVSFCLVLWPGFFAISEADDTIVASLRERVTGRGGEFTC